jgi:pyruvate, orthophosphate dikinase
MGEQHVVDTNNGKHGTRAKYVWDFADGNRELRDLLGGKGANLAEMTKLGLPVPPGFTITTEACRVFLTIGHLPAGMREEVDEHLATLERARGKRLGDADDPLLVSVRSGARFSMPGMMETVLNIGLNDESVDGLAKQAGDERFAWDSYRRLIQMFGKTVLDIEGHHFEEALDEVKRAKHTDNDLGLDAHDFRFVVEVFKGILREHAGVDFPQDPRDQMDAAINAVFHSWNSDRAVLYRRQERIPADLGTAVNVVAMVFGNMGMDSGTGVAFTRDPGTGATGIYGDYLRNAQGEDVVSGVRNTVPLQDLEKIDKASYDELLQIMAKLEGHYRDLCDIEFTIERGKLWMLQTRVGKRTAAAAFRIATQLVEEGVIDADEALRRVSGGQLVQLMFPQFDTSPASGHTLQSLGRGLAASPGAAVGKVVFDSYTAVKWSRSGEKVILVRRETNPDDLNGMIAAEGILTSRGGKTSHAAVVARGMGKTCVCGAEELDVDTKRRLLRAPDGTEVREGDIISVDGSTGRVYLGQVPVMPSPVVAYFEGQLDPAAEAAGALVTSVHQVMTRADEIRRMRVRANADTAEDAERARRMGAEGIGLCRTEHMFLGERRQHVERLILAEDDAQRREVLDQLLPMQRTDFVDILEAMDGLPTTIRLLDPPLHEFLPNITELSVRVALAEARGEENENDLRLMQAVHSMHEQNPMLGLRGVRLGLVVPGLFQLQVRALAEATAHLLQRGHHPQPEIMVPLVGSVQELEIIRADTLREVAAVSVETGVELTIPIGTMIELPRAALTAGQIAEVAEFFSFGTNDLTQTTWGFSRDDVEAAFFSTYLEMGIFGASPFETLDTEGVGELVSLGTRRGREVRPDLKVGVCGEHGGDPESVHFFHHEGLDYVSCSPFRVPVARLEAARATVSSTESDTR